MKRSSPSSRIEIPLCVTFTLSSGGVTLLKNGPKSSRPCRSSADGAVEAAVVQQLGDSLQPAGFRVIEASAYGLPYALSSPSKCHNRSCHVHLNGSAGGDLPPPPG
jgi:hypothetical protein